MAWFKRNRDEAPASSDEALDSAAPDPAPEPAAEAAPAAAAPPAVPAWMTAAPMPQVTPVIQRVLSGDARASTTLGKPTPLSLAPLGHAVTPDAPTGVVSAVAVADHHLPHDEPPLEYVQRASAGSGPARPAAPAQLLVPSFQPSRLPSLPTAAVEVQRVAAGPSLTTAPAPEPPLVLPVGEILSAPPVEQPPEAAADAATPDAPLASAAPLAPPAGATEPGPASASAPATPGADLPLAPVQRHADHPGHVDHDEAPATSAQRAPLDEPAPAPAAPADAPLLSTNPLTVPEPAAGGPAAASGTPSAPEVELPLAPVQRAAEHPDHPDHPGHVDGDDAPDAAIQRAPVEVAPLAPPPDAPLLSASPLTGPGPAAGPLLGAGTPSAPEVDLPLAPVQRSADHPDHPGHVDGDEAPDTSAQRAPLDVPAPAPTAAAIPDAPLVSAHPLTAPEPPAAATPAATDAPAAPEVDLPLAPVQRAADHPDHPGHVDGDEVPDTSAQRAPLDAPAPAPAAAPTPDAPLVSAHPLTAPEPAAAATPAATGAPAAPEVDLPLAPVQRAADHPGHVEGDHGTEGALPGAPAAPVVNAPLVGDAPPLAAPAGPPPVADAPAGGPVAPVLPLPAAPVQRSATGRRPGLGRPIAAVPPDTVEPGTVQRAPAPAMPLAAVQRAAAEEGGEGTGEPAAATTPGTEEEPSLDLAQRAPVDAPTAPLVGAAPLGPSPTAPEAPAAEAAPGAPTPELDLVQRAPLGAAASAPTSAAASSSSSGATPGAATAPQPPLVMAPLLGGRSFSTHVQRAPDSGVSTPSGPVDRTGPLALSPEPGRVYQPLAGIGMWNGAPPPDLQGPAIEAPPSHVAAAVQRALGTDVSNVRIRRDTGPTAQRLAARAFTHEGEVHIPASVGSLDSGEGASLAAHELVHAGQQSVLGSSRPHEHTPEGQALEAHARSAEHASLAGLELPKLPLAPPAPVVQRAPTDGGSSSPFSPQQLNTLLGLADNPPSGATVQRALMETEAPPRPTSAAPGGPPPRPGTPAPGGETPQELEELATKLFPTLRNLFRSELLGFRRRSGTSSDRPLS